MAEKIEKTNTPVSNSEPALSAPVVELLNEFLATSRNLNPKKTTARQIKRNLATLKDVIADLEVEISK